MTDPPEAGPEGVTCAPVERADIPRLYPLAELADMWAQEAEEARAARLSGRARGPITGFPALDKELGGHLHAGLHFVHGEPGTGKTNYALQVAAECGCPAVFVSTEMSLIVLLRRVIARTTNTYQSKLEGGELSVDAMNELLERAVAACPLLAIMDGTGRNYAAPRQIDKGPPGILEAAQVWRERHRAASVLVCVDSLHTWAAAAPGAYAASEYEYLNDALRELEQLAAELKAPVLVVAERNRPSMANAGQSSAKGTARIEYSAMSIVSLNRVLDGEGEWKVEAGDENALFAKVVKNRDGRIGHKVDMRFHGALARLREA